MNEQVKASRCRVTATPMQMWFRAWYCPKAGTLDVTRTGMQTRRCIILDAEEQFGKAWKELSTKGEEGTVIRAVRGVITLSPADTKFQTEG